MTVQIDRGRGGNTLAQKSRDMRDFFEARKGEIAVALARVGIKPERIIRALFTAAQKTPKLYECSIESVYRAMLLAAQSGLMPDGVTQQAYLIPYRNKGKMECQLQIGYRGYLTLCRRSGEVTVIKGTLVREGDVFREYRGTDDRIEHEPLPGIADADGRPRPITHAYAIAKFTNGSVDFEVMPIEEIEALRIRAQANGPAWQTDYGEMCKKTVMRRLCKRLPQSEDAARLLELDAQAEAGIPQNLEQFEPIPEAQNVDAEVRDVPPADTVTSGPTSASTDAPQGEDWDADESRRLDAEAAGAPADAKPAKSMFDKD